MFIAPEKTIRQMGIEPGMVVADFGAGDGDYTLQAAERVSNAGKVYALDVQKELLKKIKNRAENAGYNNVEILWCNLEKLGGSKLADGVADRVIISNVLFQVKDKNIIAQEAFRVLKNEGWLIVIEWNEGAKLGPISEHKVSQEEVKEIFGRVGLALEKEFDAGSFHYGLIFKKI